MTPRADQAFRLQGCQESWFLFESRAGAAFRLDLLLLLSEGGVATITKKRCRGVVLNQLHRLTHHPRSHAPAVQAALPIVILGAMTDGTALRVERGLDQREAGRRLALRRDRQPPMVFKKRRLRLLIDGPSILSHLQSPL